VIRTLTALAAAVAVAALAGCTPTGNVPEPVPTTTVTETVTATPAPRTADDPLTGLDAWTACAGAVRASSYVVDNANIEVDDYAVDAVVVQPDGSYEVTIGAGSADSTAENPIYGAQATCLVAGTVGAPEILSLSFIGLG
jgi:hypothetical protein